jgi:hypothetical protein
MLPTNDVLVAIIICVEGIMVALIGRLTIRVGRIRQDTQITKQNAAEAKEQVTNGHNTNFREEYDQRHNETISHLTELKRYIVDQFNSDRQDIRQNRDEISELEKRVTFLDRIKMQEAEQKRRDQNE